jgi:lipid-A-disaccharide synthase
MSTRVLIVAGEVSGDIHAGNLLAELKALRPEVEAFGVGGERLAGAGLDLLVDCKELAHMGLLEVVHEIPRLRRIMTNLVKETARRRPQLAVLVDSPDFNLRLAKRLCTLGIPVVLFVSPQLWAWRRGRVRVVQRVAREVLCILPFELSFYVEHGVPARYVGHPLVDDFHRDGSLDLASPRVPGRIALLPGSREMEIRQLLPTMIDALRALPDSLVCEARLVEAPKVSDTIDRVLRDSGSDRRLLRVSGPTRRAEVASCVLAWTASGTATLECALLNVPMVVGYRLHPLTYLLARVLVRISHVSLANLIAGAPVVPELMQDQWNPLTLAALTKRLLEGGSHDQVSALAEVREKLGGPGASRKAAEAVLEYLG